MNRNPCALCCSIGPANLSGGPLPPEDVRRRLGLKAGSQFVVVASDDAVVLKPVIEPDMSQFEDLLAEARRQARRAGLRKSDIADAIRDARQRGRSLLTGPQGSKT